jgi:hypothetical protein
MVRGKDVEEIHGGRKMGKRRKKSVDFGCIKYFRKLILLLRDVEHETDVDIRCGCGCGWVSVRKDPGISGFNLELNLNMLDGHVTACSLPRASIVPFARHVESNSPSAQRNVFMSFSFGI